MKSQENNLKIQYVDPAALKPNSWNVNVVGAENESKLEHSLDRLGQFKPVIVRELADGTLEILGGEHRSRIAQRSGKKVPIINLGKVDDQRAKEISIVDNGRYGADDALKLNELLSSLGSADEIASFLPYTDAELAALASSVSIALDDLDLPEDDELPTPSAKTGPTSQIMRFKIPVEDTGLVTEVIEHLIKSEGFSDSDSLTNAGDALVVLCRKYKESFNE